MADLTSLSRAFEVPWDIEVGHVTTREQLAARFGGSVYSGGIVPSSTSPNVFLFSDPSQGRKYGYDFDGPGSDGLTYYYTGKGSQGDHELTDGNASVLRHVDAGRSLRLFEADGTVPGSNTKFQRYVGEFSVDSSEPYRFEAAADRNGATRAVVVFKLVAVGPHGMSAGTAPSAADVPTSLLVPREVNSTFFYETAARAPSKSDKVENGLVEAYSKWLGGSPERLMRWAIRIEGESGRLLTDIFDTETNVLYEAKGSSGRSWIRLAVGQLLDYRRNIPMENLTTAVLLPSEPSVDLKNYLKDLGIGLAFRQTTGSFRTEGL